MPGKNGFTLIELLVVVSIIGILSVIGLVAYGTFLKNSRDARRQSDLKFIQSALEEYHADLHVYPGNLSSLSPKYMTTVPKDPKSGSNYSYACVPVATCVSYCLSANLEGADPSDECTPASGHNYGVTRP